MAVFASRTFFSGAALGVVFGLLVFNEFAQAMGGSRCTAPSITGQPKSVTVLENGFAAFSVSAQGTTLSYQWRKDGSAILGAVGASYVIERVGLEHAGKYNVVVSNSCGSVTSATASLTVQPVAGMYFPPLNGSDGDWARVTTAELGWNDGALQELNQYVQDTRGTGFIILHRGKIVVEKYWQGWSSGSADKIYSVSKSMTALMVGKAQEEGRLSIEDMAQSYLQSTWANAATWKEKYWASQVKVRHLLSMDSGLNNELKPLSQPGTQWSYNTSAYQLLLDILEDATGASRETYFNFRLFSRIGMSATRFDLGRNSLISSARDMARFGLLVLNKGRWAGEAILKDESYVLAASRHRSQEFNQSYGYLFWLNGQDSYIMPESSGEVRSGPLLPDAPQDMIMAMGAGEKRIYVVPSMNLVVVRHGLAADAEYLAGSPFDRELWIRIMKLFPQQ